MPARIEESRARADLPRQVRRHASSARQAAAAIAAGWRDGARDDQLELRPLSDGGPGFVDVLGAALSGKRLPVSTVDPLGRPVSGDVLVAGDTAYVESAQACGLHLLSPSRARPEGHHVVRARHR